VVVRAVERNHAADGALLQYTLNWSDRWQLQSSEFLSDSNGGRRRLGFSLNNTRKIALEDWALASLPHLTAIDHRLCSYSSGPDVG
jgi:hypothetical protein